MSQMALALTYVTWLIGLAICVHFLVPYHWGITRIEGFECRHERIASGVDLSDVVVTSRHLPERANGAVVLVLTDLHCNTAGRLELLRSVITELAALPADLVFLLGDFGEKKQLLSQIVDLATSLTARFGTYCVLGNHDYEAGRERLLIELLSARGVRVLQNEYEDLPELGVTLLGLARPYRSSGRLLARRDRFVLALSHSPDNLPYLSRLGAALAFSGHTHGGRIRLPFLGALLVPCLLGRFLDMGWFEKGGTKLYVTRGFGYNPGHLGNVGEISRFVLKRGTEESR
jgi:uncharacterized protein